MSSNIRILTLSVLLFSSSISFAQSVENIGLPETLEIATWNIEWFGSSNNGPANDALQINNARAIISGSGIDLWGVQEIADGDDFTDLLETLGSDFEGTLATNSVEQKIGFIYNTTVIKVRQVKHILESFSQPFASRPPLQLEAEVILPDTSIIVTFIVLHMKAFADQDSYDRRVEASLRLKNHIDFTGLATQPVIVMGDMNDELEQSTFNGNTSPYNNFIQDAANYSYVSLTLENAGEGSFCTNPTCSSTSGMLDHIMMTNELFGAYVQNSAGFIPNLTTNISFYGSSTSDHLPVVARFDFKQDDITHLEQAKRTQAVNINPPYPNPFSSTTSLSVTLTTPTQLKIEVFDLLGRRVNTLVDRFTSPGAYQYTFNPQSARPGIYMMRVSSSEDVYSVPVTFLK